MTSLERETDNAIARENARVIEAHKRGDYPVADFNPKENTMTETTTYTISADTAAAKFEASWMRHYKDRWIVIEPDGHPVDHYVQRPSAERRANSGRGLYDQRDRKVVIQPDPVERARNLTEAADAKDAQARELRVAAQLYESLAIVND